MARELGRLYVGVVCNNCGPHGEGIPADNGKLRCGKCGQYAQKREGYCAEHDVNYGELSGYDSCPLCEERRHMEAMEQEMMQRRADPRMHSTVDAPRR